MKRFMLVILAITFFLAGCSSQEDKLHGTWQCDVKASVQANDSPKIQEMLANDFTAGIFIAVLQSIQFRFDTDKKEMYMRFGKEEHQGSYTVVSEKDNTITLDNGKDSLTFILLDDNTLQTENFDKKGELHTLTFTKVLQ